ncbi:MAG TPA: hypothetical protein VGO62_08000 [Myxococcota bacterium]|jgi:hypothetical protein
MALLDDELLWLNAKLEHANDPALLTRLAAMLERAGERERAAQTRRRAVSLYEQRGDHKQALDVLLE